MDLLLRYNLQFFANDDATEEPTAKKQEEARNKGQVAKSKELDNAVGLMILFLLLRVLSGSLANSFENMFEESYIRIPDILSNAAMGGAFSAATIQPMLNYVFTRILVMVLPFFVLGVAAVFIVNVIQFGFKVTTEPMKPKLEKLNPASGLKRIFSKDSLFELLKAILKIVLIAVIAYTTIRGEADQIFVIYDVEVTQAVILMGTIIVDVGLRISLVFLALGFVDLIYQKRRHHKNLMMTKQEVKDEYKNTEGDPAVKGAQRQRMREASQRRMMQDVPKADVVITNPTHLAVALRYDADAGDRAPVVLAKGQDIVAQRIKEIARENHVEIVEDKPLARMLYQAVEVGEEIPEELYQAVATILAAVYSTRRVS